MNDQELGKMFRQMSIKQILQNEQTKNIFLKLYYSYNQILESEHNGADRVIRKNVILG